MYNFKKKKRKKALFSINIYKLSHNLDACLFHFNYAFHLFLKNNQLYIGSDAFIDMIFSD